MFMPPNSEFCCWGWGCWVEPNSDGAAGWAWGCWVFVLPNKEGVVVCCVDAPLAVGQSLCHPRRRPYSQQRRLGLASAAEQSSGLRRILRLRLGLGLCVPAQRSPEQASALGLRRLCGGRAEETCARLARVAAKRAAGLRWCAEEGSGRWLLRGAKLPAAALGLRCCLSLAGVVAAAESQYRGQAASGTRTRDRRRRQC